MKIPIVNENDEVIGEEERSVVHKEGILHREVHVWVVMDGKKIVFQKRSMTKDTWPGKLDASAGGHVEAGETYEIAGKRELQEETGLTTEIKYLDKTYSESFDPVLLTRNNKFLATYFTFFSGDINDLVIEEGSEDGFVSYTVEELRNISDSERENFIQRFLSEEYLEKFGKMIEAYENQN